MTTRKKPHAITPKRHRHVPTAIAFDGVDGRIEWCVECGAWRNDRWRKWHHPKASTKGAKR